MFIQDDGLAAEKDYRVVNLQDLFTALTREREREKVFYICRGWMCTGVGLIKLFVISRANYLNKYIQQQNWNY